MNVIVPLTRNGSPALGLTPTITIRDVDTTLPVVTGALMTEVGDGFYKYVFTAYLPNKNYAITIDGGSELLPGERYSFAGNESFYDEISQAMQDANIGGYIA